MKTETGPSRSSASHGLEIQRANGRRRRGFTLIELMIAVAIIGVLASLAQASFKTYLMRTRRAEAKLGLATIHRTQSIHFAEFGVYADGFAEIGMPLERSTMIDNQTVQGATYVFTTKALTLDGRVGANFQAIATGDLDVGDGVLDILMIENQLTVAD